MSIVDLEKYDDITSPIPILTSNSTTPDQDNPLSTSSSSQISTTSAALASRTVIETHLRLSPSRRYLILAILCIGNLTDVFSYSSTLPGMASMEKEFGMSVPTGAWFLSAASAGLSCACLIGGRLADLYGAKEVYLAGSIMFLGCSIGCALSRNSTQILIFRGLSGAASGLQIPSSLRALMQIFPDGKSQRMALAVFGGTCSLGSLVGPALGALLCAISWRAPFWACVGLCAVVLVLGVPLIPRLPKPGQGEAAAMDLVGLTLITGSLMSLLYGIINASIISTFRTYTVILPLCLCVPFAIGFFWHESRISDEKNCLIPPTTWRIRNFSLWMVICLIPNEAYNAPTFSNMVYWREVFGYSPVDLAVRMLPAGISGLIISVVIIVYSDIFKQHIRILVPLCLGMAASVCLLSSFADTAEKYWSIEFPALVLLPIGIAGLQLACFVGLMQSTPLAMAGVVGALSNCGFQMGVATFEAVFSLIQASVDSKQPDDFRTYDGIAWGDRFMASLCALLAIAFLVCYRRVKEEATETDEKSVVPRGVSKDGADGVAV